MAKKTTPRPHLSVIIPTLNEEDYLGKLLGDLARQSYNDFEVIVSDSSSDDRTVEKAKTFSDTLDLRTTVVERRSAGYGRNEGAMLARGEFLLFLDADLRVPDNFLEILAEEQQKTNADYMTTKFRSDGWNPVDRLAYYMGSRFFKKSFKQGKPLMTGCVQFIRSTLHKKQKGYNPDMTVGEDIDYSRRLQKIQAKYHFVNRLKVIASNRRFQQDGRLKMLCRNFYWSTGKQWFVRNDVTHFGHYRHNNSIWKWTGRIAWSLVAMVLIVFMIGKLYAWQNRNQPLTFGVSFSTHYAEELGLDWEATLQRSAAELPIPHYRIMSYWDRLQANDPQAIDFAELDRQLVILAENGRTATVVLGQRQPRWPECHVPSWHSDFTAEEQRILEFNYIRLVVERYENDPVITSWQLDNEPANRNFGDCPPFDRDFYQNKYDLVDRLSDKPIVITASNQSGWPLFGPVGERTGFSIYKEAHFDSFGRTNGWSFWYVPSWWHGFRAGMTEMQHGNTRSFVHELQTEPWGPIATRDLSQAELNKLFTPEELERNVRFATQTGMKEIWLWGAEYWVWRDEQFSDKSYIEQINRLLPELADN